VEKTEDRTGKKNERSDRRYLATGTVDASFYFQKVT
jgi:hypothetical protein